MLSIQLLKYQVKFLVYSKFFMAILINAKNKPILNSLKPSLKSVNMSNELNSATFAHYVLAGGLNTKLSLS